MDVGWMIADDSWVVHVLSCGTDGPVMMMSWQVVRSWQLLLSNMRGMDLAIVPDRWASDVPGTSVCRHHLMADLIGL